MQQKQMTDETLIQDLDLSVRTTNCLYTIYREANGWEPYEPQGSLPPPKIGDFRHLKDFDLLRLPNFGRKSLNEWKDILWQVDNPEVPYTQEEKALRSLAKHFRELSRLHSQMAETNAHIATLIGSGRYA